jgi:hypothetical protein
MIMSKTHTYRGFVIERGSYYNTTDDRADRWYARRPSDEMIDRRGPGHRTLSDIKAEIDELLALEARG